MLGYIAWWGEMSPDRDGARLGILNANTNQGRDSGRLYNGG